MVLVHRGRRGRSPVRLPRAAPLPDRLGWADAGRREPGPRPAHPPPRRTAASATGNARVPRGVLFDLLLPLRIATIDVRPPSDPRARDVAGALLDNPVRPADVAGVVPCRRRVQSHARACIRGRVHTGVMLGRYFRPTARRSLPTVLRATSRSRILGSRATRASPPRRRCFGCARRRGSASCFTGPAWVKYEVRPTWASERIAPCGQRTSKKRGGRNPNGRIRETIR